MIYTFSVINSFLETRHDWFIHTGVSYSDAYLAFSFISAEAFKAIKVLLMHHIPLPWTKTSRIVVTRAATWFFNM